MMLVDGGKVVDYTAEEGYFRVDNQSQPSMLNGRFMDTLKNRLTGPLRRVSRIGSTCILLICRRSRGSNSARAIP